MKFLCLHGMGTSARIFEAELRKYIETLGVSHEFHFVDGFAECGPAAGLPESAPPPYFLYYKSMYCSSMQAAHEELNQIMEEEGPFDAAIGFSQGSALLLSILMHHEITNTLKTPPFKFVVLFSTTISISPDQKFGQEYIEKYEKYYDHDRDMTKNSKESILAPKSRLALKVPGQKSQLVAEYQDLIAQGVRAAVENGESEEEAISGIKDINSFPRIFHPFMCEERIRIPTVHISGKKDPYKLQAEMARRLCEKSVLRYIEHGGQHQVPRATKDVKKVVEAIEWAMHQATFVGFQY